MVKISRITVQKKNVHRYNIFLEEGKDDYYAFSVDEDVLIEENLRKGLELDEAMINTLKHKDTLQKSYQKVIQFLGYRTRTRKEIQDYLVKNEVDEEHIEKIFEKLSEQNLLDDQEFALMFVRSRIRSTAKGPGMVKQELREKGVPNNLILKAVELYTYGVQYDKAEGLVEKRLKRSSNESFTKQLEKVRAQLMRNGFDSEVIKDVLSEVHDEKDQDEEWEAVVHQGERLVTKHERKLTGFKLRQKVKEGLYRKGFSFELIDRFLDKSEEDED